jgi:hypothetical protein
MDVGEAEITPLESVGKLMVIHAEEVQESGVQVVHVDFVFSGIETEIIRPAIDGPGLDAPACHPNGIPMRMMISTDLVWLEGTLHHRSPTELSAPKDQGFVEKTALLEILDEGDRRLIGLGATLLQIEDEIAIRPAMMIPAPVVELNKADSALDQSTGQ